MVTVPLCNEWCCLLSSFLCAICYQSNFRYCFTQNLLELVSYQARQKQLQAVKEGKYTPLCSTEQAWRNEQQKLQERIHAICGIVHQVQQEQPQYHRALQWLRQCLESRLGSQEAC